MDQPSTRETAQLLPAVNDPMPLLEGVPAQAATSCDTVSVLFIILYVNC